MRNEIFLHIPGQKHTKFGLVANIVITFQFGKTYHCPKEQGVGILQTGMSSRAVARGINSCHSTILRHWILFQQTDDVRERPKKRAPTVATPTQDR